MVMRASHGAGAPGAGERNWLGRGPAGTGRGEVAEPESPCRGCGVGELLFFYFFKIYVFI